MFADLLAGISQAPVVIPSRSPCILAFDSGLGGLTVFSELLTARPDADFIYVADDAGFPYGRLTESGLVARVLGVMRRLVEVHSPDLVVVACNTASTLVLPHLRSHFDLPFIGTVPAIKPAAAASRTRRISILATPGTVARDYTRGLIEAYAGGCRVELVGSHRLAAFAEAELRGAPVAEDQLAAEIAPCFVEDEDGRTDVVVLACTHYPLLLSRLRGLAPWPVTWIDPAPAIARRMTEVLQAPMQYDGLRQEGGRLAVFTGGEGLDDALRAALAARGLPKTVIDPFPLDATGH
ncbi:glutamate racemase [Enterovirga aerilata]|uniref:Glutamate racemase n=1 Tax=Enterovirga aerilata TaxID=2730920 RepID=A0A849HY19_9HYPH|nr:glutamate racemase [Enterovirga sp. DB1703]NNM72002.1 glutamate racemase [Enterovirga sp. DB1703]